jgi:hypothetical protein
MYLSICSQIYYSVLAYTATVYQSSRHCGAHEIILVKICTSDSEYDNILLELLNQSLSFVPIMRPQFISITTNCS